MLIDFGAAQCKKFPQRGCVKSPVVFAIQLQPDATAWRQVFGEIIKEEFPFRHVPETGLFMVVEADHEGGDKIKSSSEIGKRSKRLNARDNATDSEQACDFRKHRQVIQIETKSLMSEQLRDMEKISGATAKIENAPWPRQIEFNFANAANVDVNPAFKIEIFRLVFAWIFDGVALANLLKIGPINCFNNSSGLEWNPRFVKKPARMFSCAG